jgi:hypothetical protein
VLHREPALEDGGLMVLYAIQLPDGRLITDPEWRCPADVMRGAHGHGVNQMPGELVRLDDHPKRANHHLEETR